MARHPYKVIDARNFPEGGMSDHRIRSRGIAMGTMNHGLPMVACRFDEYLFDEIRGMADAGNVSFAEQVRALVRDGLKYRAMSREQSAA